MKVLLISPLPPPVGGIGTWTEKYLSNCPRFNIEADIVNTAAIGKRAEKINNPRNVRDEIVRTWNIFSGVISHLRRKKYSVVHVNTSCEKFGILRDLICVNIAKIYGIPVIVHCRCNVEFQIKSRYMQFAFRSLVNKADRVIVLNRKSLAYVNKIENEKAVLVPNFIENKFSEIQCQIRDNIKKVIFVGHVQFVKGYMEILGAAKARPDLNFILIGPIRDEVKQVIAPPNITFIGQLPNFEIKKYLVEADIFLFPSHTEGFSNALLEAMACGLPVITTDVGANKDMIEDEGGIIVTVGSHKEIVAALKDMESSSVRRRMSIWNRKKVEANYTIESVMKLLMDIYSMRNV